MNKCGTCKYFGGGCGTESFFDPDTDDMVDFESPYHICNLIVMKPEYSKMRALMLDATNKPAAYVQDASQYHAVLCVSEEYGCNQWEAA